MIIKPTEIPAKDRYKLVIGTILPRPIAWVSTMSKAGELNLAPFSYFTVASTNPLTLLFCPQNSRDNVKKDTLRNVYEVPEFVINLTNEETAQAMNRTATTLPHGHSEFEYAGLTPMASQTISVPRVAEAPVAFECKLQQVVTVSEKAGGGSVVFGEVLCIHIRDDIYADGYVLLERLKPIGRLAGGGYARVSDTFELNRLPTPVRNQGAPPHFPL